MNEFWILSFNKIIKINSIEEQGMSNDTICRLKIRCPKLNYYWINFQIFFILFNFFFISYSLLTLHTDLSCKLEDRDSILILYGEDSREIITKERIRESNARKTINDQLFNYSNWTCFMIHDLPVSGETWIPGLTDTGLIK